MSRSWKPAFPALLAASAALLAAPVAATLSPGGVAGTSRHAVEAQEDAGTRFLRQPDVSADRIAFVHANDIWTVGRDGGRAVRLTSGEGGS